MNKNLLASIILLTFSSTTLAAPFAKGDVSAGKKSYDQHNCSSCHIKMFGGDGSKIFTRPSHKIKSAASLATQINTCSVNLGLMLFEDEEENLAAYLNQNYYKFK